MKKRVALKILKNKDKLRYKPSQIEEAMRVAARYGIKVEELNSTSQAEEGAKESEAEQQ